MIMRTSIDNLGRALGGLGTCQVPQPGVAMVYPACPPNPMNANDPVAQFVAPTPVGAPSCSSGPSMFTAECIAQLLANQKADMTAHDAGQRSIFLADCLNSSVPADVCHSRWDGPGGTTPNAGSIPWGSGSGPNTGLSPKGTVSTTPQRGVSISPAKSVYTVGESFVLTIRGQANARVTVIWNHDGAQTSAALGWADGSGVFTLSGTFTADQIGSWSEAFSVDNTPVGSLQFGVQGQVADNTKNSMDTGNKNQDKGSGGGSTTQDFFKNLTDQFSSVPQWVMIGGAALVGFMIMRGK